MERKWLKILLLATFSISISACGKKKETSGEVPNRQARPANPGNADKGTIPAPTEGADPHDRQKDGLGAPPPIDHDLKGNEVGPDRRGPPPGSMEKPPGDNSDSAPSPPSRPAPNPAPGSNPETATEPTPRMPQPLPETLEENENRSNIERNHNRGNDSSDAQISYSGSAPDGLRDELLRQALATSDPRQKAADLEFAKSLLSVQMNLNFETNQIQVTLSVARNDAEKKTLSLQGTLNASNKAQLTSSEEGLRGALTCMDQGQTCETRVLVLAYNGARIPVIYRRTNLSLDAEWTKRKCSSPECLEFFTILKHTEAGLQDQLSLKQAKMESFEVIQGRSGFKLVVQTRNQEVMKIAGPLVSLEPNSGVSVQAHTKLLNGEKTDSNTGQVLSTKLHDSMSDVQIISNNGRGQVQLEVKMKSSLNGAEDRFYLTLNRKVVPIRPLAR